MTGPANEDRLAARRPGSPDTQLVPAKALDTTYVYVETLDADGAVVVEKVESEVAILWPSVQTEVVVNKRGKTPETALQLPKQVGQDILALLLEYCRYHRFPGRSDKERKIFDEKFIRLDTRRLCELTSAADSLDMKPLVDLSSRALARMIEGKTPEEIRETFHLPDDLTEEEKLEPVKNVADDPRIRLLNRLYAKKRKELAERKAELLQKENGKHPPAMVNQDTRSVEELLSFIQEEEKQQGQAKARPKKKKSKKKRDGSREKGEDSDPHVECKPSSIEASMSSTTQEWPQSKDSDGEANGREANGVEANGENTSLEPELLDEAERDALDDAELDVEIEAFERSLNADWEDRRAELILMAGAFQSRRVTTLTSLSNFKARPREAAKEKEEKDTPENASSKKSILAAAEGPATPLAEPKSRPILSSSTSQPAVEAGRNAKPVSQSGSVACPPQRDALRVQAKEWPSSSLPEQPTVDPKHKGTAPNPKLDSTEEADVMADGDFSSQRQASADEVGSGSVQDHTAETGSTYGNESSSTAVSRDLQAEACREAEGPEGQPFQRLGGGNTAPELWKEAQPMEACFHYTNGVHGKQGASMPGAQNDFDVGKPAAPAFQELAELLQHFLTRLGCHHQIRVECAVPQQDLYYTLNNASETRKSISIEKHVPGFGLLKLQKLPDSLNQ